MGIKDFFNKLFGSQSSDDDAQTTVPEADVQATPEEQPAVETPSVEETPAVETPSVEEPVVEAPAVAETPAEESAEETKEPNM